MDSKAASRKIRTCFGRPDLVNFSSDCYRPVSQPHVIAIANAASYRHEARGFIVADFRRTFREGRTSMTNRLVENGAHGAIHFRSRGERQSKGKAMRSRITRASHAVWKPQDGRNVLEILEKSNVGRRTELVPIRHGRMLRSPFTFLRGSAALMAHDLAATPTTGIRVQACGDCHLLNFGLFATPERNLVFDINDFDETLPGPWEWDVKRLAASFVCAARDNHMSDETGRDAVRVCVQSYREKLREFSRMSPLEVWYTKFDMNQIIEMAPDEKARKLRMQLADKARKQVIENHFPKITEAVAGRHRFVEQPPVLVRVAEGRDAEIRELMADYRESLSDDRRVLLDRYQFEDLALKVVGIGSVGTTCCIGLFFSEDNHPLILQFKQARRSVLEPYVGASAYDNQGQRVVRGQRLMQSSSDIFLGWLRTSRGDDFFVRQLRDMKLSIPMDGYSAKQLERYASICGWTLARAHAKSGDAASISGYLGKSDEFDDAIADFAVAYADQNEADHKTLVEAVKAGRLEALVEDL